MSDVYNKEVLCSYNGKKILVTTAQKKKIDTYLKYFREGYPKMEAMKKAAEDLGLETTSIKRIIYHKRLREPISFLERTDGKAKTKYDVAKHTTMKDIATVSDIVSIAWIVSQLKEIYDSTPDDKLKKDILVALAKLNSQYADVLSNDLERIRKMSMAELIEEAVDLLIQLSGNEFAGEVVKAMFKEYLEKFNDDIVERQNND